VRRPLRSRQPPSDLEAAVAREVRSLLGPAPHSAAALRAAIREVLGRVLAIRVLEPPRVVVVLTLGASGAVSLRVRAEPRTARDPGPRGRSVTSLQAWKRSRRQLGLDPHRG
jgi:hypothetical protein